MKRLVLTLLIAFMASPLSSAQRPATLDVQYRDVAGRLVGASLVDVEGFEKLSYLTTRIGNRLSGSPSLDVAIRWMFDRMNAEGFENTRLQPVKVVHWVRGRESARMIAPFDRPLNILGL